MRTSTIKSLAAIALTGAGSALVVGFQTPGDAVLASSTTTAGPTTTTTSTTGATAGGTASATSTTTTPTSTSAATVAPSTSTTAVAAATNYADGTYTGKAVQEPWGAFQVQAVVSGGQITEVVLVSSPQDGHSSRINDQAVPILTQAAIAAQSANIDLVSGATWTSESYVTSLQAALDQAQAAAQAGA
ncbi:MAG TPA: FMN-binding protein [Candidatus Limnocylindrales bacterium]